MSLKEKIKKLLQIYTQSEVAAILNITQRSVANYATGANASKKVTQSVNEFYTKVSENNWKKIGIKEYQKVPPAKQITAEAALLRVLVQEFSEYKADKEGLNADDVRRDIENKARLVLDVAGRV